MQELNLFKDITQDIDPAVMTQKQEQFDAMEEQIKAVLMGGISDFYADDFPGANFKTIFTLP